MLHGYKNITDAQGEEAQKHVAAWQKEYAKNRAQMEAFTRRRYWQEFDVKPLKPKLTKDFRMNRKAREQYDGAAVDMVHLKLHMGYAAKKILKEQLILVAFVKLARARRSAMKAEVTEEDKAVMERLVQYVEKYAPSPATQ